jgi:hypothetical protein
MIRISLTSPTDEIRIFWEITFKYNISKSSIMATSQQIALKLHLFVNSFYFILFYECENLSIFKAKFRKIPRPT